MKLIFLLIFPLILFPQSDSEKIFWNESRKLTWEDFRAKPLKNASFVATTNSGISFKYSYSISNNNVEVEYTVISFFDPNGSWYMPEKVNEHILKHEQGHFDITELHVRILRKNLESKKFSKKVKSEVERIYQQVEQQRRAMQTKFDVETNHSRNEKVELQWRKFISQQLANYESWK